MATYPQPGTPEGDAWAAAGFPRDEQGNALLAEPAAPKDPPAVGSLVSYTFHDAYSAPPRDRTQVVLVSAVDADGKVRGYPLGFADDAAAFNPAQLDY